MSFHLAVTPAGSIIAVETDTDDDVLNVPTSETDSDLRSEKRIARLLAVCQAEGLFTLAAERANRLKPSFEYWRGFASRYLTQLCHVPQTNNTSFEEVAPPTSEEMVAMLLDVPPMQGSEYLTESVLGDIWVDLDNWVRSEAAAHRDGLFSFLQKRAPIWHQVGRVCFHLAENRRDPDYPFAFLATYAPNLTAGARIQYKPLSESLREYAGTKNKKALIKLLSPVQLAAEKSTLAKELVASGDLYQPLAWTPREAHRFLQEIPLFEESGLLVRVPDWWQKRSRPRVGITIGEKKKNTFNTDAMLDFHVTLALGDQELTESEWNELMQADEGLALLKGQWVEVDRDKLAQALDHWKRLEEDAKNGLSFAEGMRLLAGAPIDLTEQPDEEQWRQWAFVDAGKWFGQVLRDLRAPDNRPALGQITSLKATLREYQETGVAWLHFLSKLGLGACLADDMGLGKTVQVLALLAMLQGTRRRKAALLVVPASLLGNWKSEMERFTPSLRTLYLHPSEVSKERLESISRRPDRALAGIDVVLTTYGMLYRQTWLMNVEWQLVVIDEAQAIKNPAARQTKAVKKIQADARIALTGTPVENRLSDLWSLFDFLCPGLLGTQKKFKDFVKALNARKDQRYAPLRQLVQPYILRRLKTDKRVISDLPDKAEVRAFCSLSKRQAALYAKLVREMGDALENQDGIRRRGLVLAYLMRFKQLCNHPSQVLGDGAYQPKDSGKFARLAEICEEIAARQEKALVFTQFREMTEPLASFLKSVFGRAGLMLHGSTAVTRRKKLVDQFQSDDGPPFFVLSLKAGGTGLNLTNASHVIHFDRWWNPAVENQATDRAFRIGQHRNVLVHKFICRGTVEEKIDSLIEEKKQLASDILDGGAEKLLTELSDDDLIRLVALDVDRACA